MIKVFISHQSADSVTAARVAARLKVQGLDTYLDVIDPYIKKNGEDLAEHIRDEMSKCTQLLAVVSFATRDSQWVPWEIGVATEKDYPLATYSLASSPPPEFLQRWPYLRSDSDIDEYVKASKAAEQGLINKRASDTRAVRHETTREFYRTLRKSLRQ